MRRTEKSTYIKPGARAIKPTFLSLCTIARCCSPHKRVMRARFSLLLLALLCNRVQGFKVAQRSRATLNAHSHDANQQAAMLIGGVSAGLVYTVGANLSYKMRTCFALLDCIETVKPILSITQQSSIALAAGALAVHWTMAHESDIVALVFGPIVPPVPGNSRIARFKASRAASKSKRRR